jgi:undecaprenyl pyrophosphate synthase
MEAVDGQILFNVLVGVAGALGGWILNTVWQEVKQLQKNERETTKAIANIETFLAGHYTTREEFTRVMENIFRKLDEIAEKMNGKEDRRRD